MRRVIFYVFCLFLCCGCSNDKNEVTVLKVTQQSFTVGNREGKITLDIHSNGIWDLSSKAVWCEVLTKSGEGDAKVEVKVLANNTERERKGSLVLSGQDVVQEIIVSQAALLLGIDTTALTFTAEGGEAMIGVTANVDWSVECNTDWLQISPLSGQDTGSFTITVSPSRIVKERQADVYVKAGMVRRQLTVTQKGLEGVWHIDGEVKLYREEDAGNPVKLVFMGDGFTQEDMLVGGAYDQAMEEAIQAFLATEPYPTYRKYFCPYIVYAVSKDRGMSTRGSNEVIKVKKQTAFSVDLKENTTLMNADMNTVLQYAKKVPGLVSTKASIIVAVNDSRYAGTCYHWGNGQTVSLVPMNRDLRPPGGFAHLITHEGAGHGFGRLDDEYTGNGQITTEEIGVLENHHRAGQFFNVTTSKDPSTVYWCDFIGREGYELVGFYEGAHYYKQGVWRCEERNCMIDNIFYFSVACRLSIVKRLKEIAGEAFDLNDFIQKDIQKAPTAAQLAGTRSYTPDYYPAPTSPVWVKD